MDQNKIEELERLGELLRAGAITQDEFERLKKQSLDGLAGQPPKPAKVPEVVKASSAGASAAKNSSATRPPQGWAVLTKRWAALSKNRKIGIVSYVTLFVLMLSAAVIYQIIDSRNSAASQRRIDEIVAEERAAGAVLLEDGQAIMPDMICMNLQDAQDLIQEETDHWYSSSYEVGGSRRQIRDRNWVVVEQSPAAGEILEADDDPDFGVVNWLDGPKLKQHGCE